MKRPALKRLACTLILAFCACIAVSQPVIKVIGGKNNQLIKQQVKLFLGHLDVQENIHLTIILSTKMPDKLDGITISHPSPEPDNYHIIRVLVDAKLSRAKQLLVLAHEMIHVKQYAKSELKLLDDQRVIWKEKEYFVSRGYNRYMPWEDEAYHADLNLVRLDKSFQNQMQEILAEKPPNRPSNTSSGKCSYLKGKCTSKSQKNPQIKENSHS